MAKPIDSYTKIAFASTYTRVNGQPMDDTVVWNSFEEAQDYASTDKAFVGQVLTVVTNKGTEEEPAFTSKVYVVDNTDGDLVEVGSTGLNCNDTAKCYTIKNLRQGNSTGELILGLDETEGVKVGDKIIAHIAYKNSNGEINSRQVHNCEVLRIGQKLNNSIIGKYTEVTIRTDWSLNGQFITLDEIAKQPDYIAPAYDTELNSFRIIGEWDVGNREIGAYSTATGVETRTASKGAHAEGCRSIAYGSWSHAEGIDTKAAYASHSEGTKTEASAENSHAEGQNTTASGGASHAEGSASVASGGFSHAEGSTTIASGEASHSEGTHTEASGGDSHAEGQNTTASSDASHAEGIYTTASGLGSHAEGKATTASGNYAHAEGLESTATQYSHAEGYKTSATAERAHSEGSETHAEGVGSHAEGHDTYAKNRYSHAEGYCTIAIGRQHVQGKYNLEDEVVNVNTDEGQFAHIVGNGSKAKRSNAHTIDWLGNAWYSGDVYVGSTSGVNKDDGSKKLATEEYVAGTVNTRIEEIVNGESVDGKEIKVAKAEKATNADNATYATYAKKGETEIDIADALSKINLSVNTYEDIQKLINEGVATEGAQVYVSDTHEVYVIVKDPNTKVLTASRIAKKSDVAALETTVSGIDGRVAELEKKGGNGGTSNITIVDKNGNTVTNESKVMSYTAVSKSLSEIASGLDSKLSGADMTNDNGAVCARQSFSAPLFRSTSDARLKENIRSYECQNSILDLDVKQFDYIGGAKDQIGCLAQDLQKICPQIVNEDEKGYLSILESKIVYLLLEEVKKLRKEVDELKSGA